MLVAPRAKWVERDWRSIARARARVAKASLRNANFTQSDVNQIVSNKPFDAAVGRFILMYLPQDRGHVDRADSCFAEKWFSERSEMCSLPDQPLVLRIGAAQRIVRGGIARRHSRRTSPSLISVLLKSCPVILGASDSRL